MKLKEVSKAVEGLMELSKGNLGAKNNFKVAIRIRELSKYHEEYNVQHDSLLCKHGVITDEGKYYLSPEAKKEFNAEMLPLENNEIDIDLTDKIKIKEEDYTTAETLLKCFDFVELDTKE